MKNHVVLGLEAKRSVVPLVFVIVFPAVGVIVTCHDPELLVRILGLADRTIQDAGKFYDTVLLSLVPLCTGFLLILGDSPPVFSVLEVDRHDVQGLLDAVDMDLIPAAVIDDYRIRFAALDDADAVDGESRGNHTRIVCKPIRSRSRRSAGNDEMILVSPPGAEFSPMGRQITLGM